MGSVFIFFLLFLEAYEQKVIFISSMYFRYLSVLGKGSEWLWHTGFTGKPCSE